MAHKKGGGSSKNNRDSKPKMRGVKVYGGQAVRPGGIIIRQCGSRWTPGKNVKVGRDWSIFSLIEGTVKFEREGRQVSVYPAEAAKKN